MSDLISREDALNSNYRMYDAKSGIEWVPVFHIEDLPSAEPEPKWIPVTEALPEMKEVVLITNDKGNVTYGKYQGTFRNNNEWFWRHKTLQTVIAWMPLPEPWRCE